MSAVLKIELHCFGDVVFYYADEDYHDGERFWRGNILQYPTLSIQTREVHGGFAQINWGGFSVVATEDLLEYIGRRYFMPSVKCVIRLFDTPIFDGHASVVKVSNHEVYFTLYDEPIDALFSPEVTLIDDNDTTYTGPLLYHVGINATLIPCQRVYYHTDLQPSEVFYYFKMGVGYDKSQPGIDYFVYDDGVDISDQVIDYGDYFSLETRPVGTVYITCPTESLHAYVPAYKISLYDNSLIDVREKCLAAAAHAALMDALPDIDILPELVHSKLWTLLTGTVSWFVDKQIKVSEFLDIIGRHSGVVSCIWQNKLYYLPSLKATYGGVDDFVSNPDFADELYVLIEAKDIINCDVFAPEKISVVKQRTPFRYVVESDYGVTVKEEIVEKYLFLDAVGREYTLPVSYFYVDGFRNCYWSGIWWSASHLDHLNITIPIRPGIVPGMLCWYERPPEFEKLLSGYYEPKNWLPGTITGIKYNFKERTMTLRVF